jgi:hypothetical protein
MTKTTYPRVQPGYKGEEPLAHVQLLVPVSLKHTISQIAYDNGMAMNEWIRRSLWDRVSALENEEGEVQCNHKELAVQK